MSKFIKMESGDPIAAKIERISNELGISRYVDIAPRYLSKPLKNNVGAVYKWNDISETLTGQNTIIVAVYGDAFDRVDDETQDFWLINLISQIEYDFDKDKVVINKNLITVPLCVYQKYEKLAIDKKELEVHVLNQLAEEEKEKKQMEKEMKKKKKN